MKKKHIWNIFVINILYYILFVLFLIVNLLPMKLLYLISTMMAGMAIHFTWISVIENSRMNFQRVYPQYSKKKIDNLCRRYIATYIDFVFELIKSVCYSETKMKKHCKFVNINFIKEKFNDHKFVICYGGHLVNVELLVSLPLWLEDYGMCHLYLSRNSKTNKIKNALINLRGRYGAINIPSYSPLRTLYKLYSDVTNGNDKYKGYVFGTLADMDTYKKDAFYAPFFNYQLEVMTGSERIGRKFDMAFVFAKIMRPKRGYYEIEFQDMEIEKSKSDSYTTVFVKKLQQNIEMQPELWIQWGSCRF